MKVNRDWSWLARWTWAAPRVTTSGLRRGRNGRYVVPAAWSGREREHDYALMPEATLPGECLRRGFLESA